MKNPGQNRLSRLRVSGKWLVMILAALAGCGGPPQVGAGNHRLIE